MSRTLSLTLLALIGLISCQKSEEVTIQNHEPGVGTSEAYLAGEVQKILDHRRDFYLPQRSLVSDAEACPVPIPPSPPVKERPNETQAPTPSPSSDPSPTPSPSVTPPPDAKTDSMRSAFGDPSACGWCVYLCLRDANAACRSMTECLDGCTNSECREGSQCNIFYHDCMRKAEANLLDYSLPCSTFRRDCMSSKPRPMDGIDYNSCHIPYERCMATALEQRARQRQFCRDKKKECEDGRL